MTRWLACVLVLTTLAASAGADAPRRTDDPIDQRVARARAHLARGELDAARAQLEAAYAIEARPGLLFALGQVELNLGNYPAAIAYYERFIATGPADDQVALAQQAIGAARMRIVAPPPAPPAPIVKLVERPAPIVRRRWRIEDTGLVALGGLAAVTAGVLVVHAGRLGDDRGGSLADYDARVDQAHTERWAGLGLVVLGVTAATIAVVRWRLDRTEVVVSARGDGAAVTASTRW